MKISGLSKNHWTRLKKNRYLLVLLALLSLFILTNCLSYIYFHKRAYPKTTVGRIEVGGKTYADISNKLSPDLLLPTQFSVTGHNKKETVELSSLGLGINKEATLSNIKKSHALVPLWNFFKTHEARTSVIFDEEKLRKQADNLSGNLSKQSVDARIVIKEGIFTLEPSQEGSFVESEKAADSLKRAVNSGKASVVVTPKILKPKIQTSDLQQVHTGLLNQQNTPLTFTYGQKNTSPAPMEVSSWYIFDGEKYVLSDSRIRSYIQQAGSVWGIGVENLETAVSEVKTSVQATKKLSFGLVAKKVLKSYKYCTALRNVDSSHLDGFNSRLASVYANSGGWSLDGKVTFTRVTSGCSFTVWLAAAQQVPSFGGVCDSNWSCRNGSNVVINFDRWQNATSAWNGGGGGLEDYRVMVINHETGHWLGFGHKNCGGVGQLAPVMQQQSIDLQGCKFNPWPLDSERSTLRSSLGG